MEKQQVIRVAIQSPMSILMDQKWQLGPYNKSRYNMDKREELTPSVDRYEYAWDNR